MADKFFKSKQKTEGPKDSEKTLSQKGVNFQDEARKGSLRTSDVEVTTDDIVDEFAKKLLAVHQIEDHYGINDKRRAKILEKVLCGPFMPDAMAPIKKNNQGEAAYYLALRDLQDVVVVGTEIQFREMEAAEAARREAQDEKVRT